MIQLHFFLYKIQFSHKKIIKIIWNQTVPIISFLSKNNLLRTIVQIVA